MEAKAEESLAAQEEIINMNHKDLTQMRENKSRRRDELLADHKEIEEKYNENITRLIHDENRLQSLNNRLESE
jgi:hypothetical protein